MLCEEKVAAKKQFSKKPEMGAAPLMQRTVMIYDTKTGTFGAGAPMLDQSAWPMATIDGNTIFSLGGEGGVRLWHPATFQIGRIDMNLERDGANLPWSHGRFVFGKAQEAAPTV
jgi:hypothetical protein